VAGPHPAARPFPRVTLPRTRPWPGRVFRAPIRPAHPSARPVLAVV